MVVEGDSLRVIQAIIATRSSRTMFGHVVAEIHSLVSNVSCSFCHVKIDGINLLMPSFVEQLYLLILMCG